MVGEIIILGLVVGAAFGVRRFYLRYRYGDPEDDDEGGGVVLS